MLDIHRKDAGPNTKIYFSHSILPTYIDPQNVSMKKKPFSEEIYDLVQHELDNVDGAARAQYARMHIKVGDLLETEFLNSYIKQGNVTMLSEGRPLVDNRFELYDGTLRMELNRPTYERCGLQGKPIEDGGKKHQKQRWIVEYDLKAPSMKHGGKAFGRLQWACKNVLDQSLTWLFYNFNPSFAESLADGKEAVSKHSPWIHKIEPSTTRLDNVLVPQCKIGHLDDLYDDENAVDLLEWLHLVGLTSPRIKQGDNIDPHLSRYEVPDLGHGIAATNMVCVKWSGFIPPAFMRDLFIAITRVAFKGRNKARGDPDIEMEGNNEPASAVVARAWFAMSAQAFGGKQSWTTMHFQGGETLVWETES